MHRLPERDRTAHVDSLHLSSSDTDEAHCPLCTAAHPALPASSPQIEVRLTLVSEKIQRKICRHPLKSWPFAQFSRPPPVLHV